MIESELQKVTRQRDQLLKTLKEILFVAEGTPTRKKTEAEQREAFNFTCMSIARWAREATKEAKAK